MPDGIDALLRSLAGDLQPIRAMLEKHLERGSDAKLSSDALEMARSPKTGWPVFTIFPGIPEPLLQTYERIHEVELHPQYRQILGSMNGAFLFQLSLFGVPPSMAKEPPLLDRSRAWPLDVGTAQSDWKDRYTQDREQFYFGGGARSWSENVGYFLGPDGEVTSRRAGGMVIGRWPGFREFLTAELVRMETLQPEYEDRMQKVLSESNSRSGTQQKR